MPRILRTANFRLTVLYAIIFSLSVCMVGAIVFFSIRHSLEEQLRAHIQSETNQLLRDYGDDGLEELRHDIRERLETRASKRLRYAVQSPDGKKIFDKMTVMPSAGWHIVDNPVPMLLLVTELDSGYRLAVAGELAEIEDIKAAVRNASIWALLVTLMLGTIGGVFVSWRFLARVDRLAKTAEHIGSGQLSLRIPLQGGGDDFDQLAMIINHMLGRIERLVEDTRNVSTNIAHDLRTPLGHIRQQLEALSDDVPQVNETIALLDDTLETFSALLRIAEIESGARRAGFAQVEMSTLVRHVAAMYQPVAEDSGHILTAYVADAITVQGDRSLLTQLVVNLIENALRHTPAGATIAVTLTKEAFWVSDNGPGIPDVEKEHILKPFYRMDHSRNTPGNGLGLSLVAAIAKIHDAVLVLKDMNPGLKVEIAWQNSLMQVGKDG